VYHIDLYRLESPRDALAIGILDYFGGNGVCIVEWAEKIADLLPPNVWRMNIEVVDEQTRRITISK
jgi:tRNA threonylcarbamoyladenosine biosynthesis protein TsaE